MLVGGGSFQNVNLITTNQNQEQKLTKIFKLKQVKFLTKTQLLEQLLVPPLEQLLAPLAPLEQLPPPLELLLQPPREHLQPPLELLLPPPLEHLPPPLELLLLLDLLLLLEHLRLLEHLLLLPLELPQLELQLLLLLEQLLQLKYSHTVHGIDVTCFVGC